jgi:prepilin-type N-terminal cleavage/methylation domain-containing protein
MPHARRRNNAFTLVELMVVISIVALLVALLLPALASAREGAQLTLCMGNQRQMSNAMFTYSEASNGYAPSMYSSSGQWSGQIDKVTSLTGTIYLPNSATTGMSQAAADTFVERNVWHCPTVGLSASTMDGNAGRQYNLPTYTFNLYVGYTYPGGYRRLTHLDRYAQPDRVPWLMDGYVTTNATSSIFTTGILGAAAKPLAMFQYVKHVPVYTQPPSYGGAPHYNKTDPLFYNYCNNPATYPYKGDALGTYAFIDLHVAALGVDVAKNKRNNKEILFSFKNFAPSVTPPGMMTDVNWWEMGP